MATDHARSAPRFAPAKAPSVTPTEAGRAQFELTLRVLRHTLVAVRENTESTNRQYGWWRRPPAWDGMPPTTKAAGWVTSTFERFVLTARRELLDHLLIFSARQLEAMIKEFLVHYHQARPHQGLERAAGSCPPIASEAYSTS